MIDNLPVLQNDAINRHFEEVGYEYSDSVLSMGSVLVMILISPLIAIIFLVIRYVCCCQRVENFAKQ